MATETAGNSCCPPGGEPSKEAKELGVTSPTRGKVETINGVLTYIAEPSDAAVEVRGVVVVFHDIFGFGKGRLHHVCDEIADDGYVVLSGDWFGDDLAPTKGLMSFLTNSTKFMKKIVVPWNKVNARLEKIKTYINENEKLKDLPKACLGFCWGGWAVFKAISSDTNLNKSQNGKDDVKFFQAAATFHPGLSLTHIQGESFEKLVHKVSCPVLLMPAGFDPPSVRQDGYVIKELRKIEEFGERCEVVEFMAVNHGFACRGDLKKPKVKEAYVKGMEKLKRYFRANL